MCKRSHVLKTLSEFCLCLRKNLLSCRADLKIRWHLPCYNILEKSIFIPRMVFLATCLYMAVTIRLYFDVVWRFACRPSPNELHGIAYLNLKIQSYLEVQWVEAWQSNPLVHQVGDSVDMAYPLENWVGELLIQADGLSLSHFQLPWGQIPVRIKGFRFTELRVKVALHSKTFHPCPDIPSVKSFISFLSKNWFGLFVMLVNGIPT